MPQKLDPRKVEAKRRFLLGDTIQSIADFLGVNRKTIERWANDGGWREQEELVKVVAIDKPRGEAYSERRKRRGQQEVDDLELVEMALMDVSLAMDTAKHQDLRALGSLASSLVKLLEYRRKVAPPTAAELAEQVLALGVSPQDFVSELKERWQLRA